MNDPATLAATLLGRVAKLLEKLSPEQLEALAKGEAEIAFVSPETTITASTRRPAAKVRGTARRPASREPRLSVDEIVRRLPELSDRDEARNYLEQGNPLVADLRKVGRQLNVTLPSKGTKDVLIDKLVTGVVGYRLTHESILGGAYRP